MRRQTSAWLSLLLLCAVVLLAEPAAHAMLVTHSTAGTLFDETYESQVVTTTPTTALIDPNGNGESWGSTTTGNGPVGSTLTWNAANGGPAANEGTQYVRLERVTGSQGTIVLVGNWDAPGAPVAVTGGDLTLSFSAYIPSGSPTQAFSFALDDLPGTTAISDAAKAFELTTIVDGANLRIGRLNSTFDAYINTNLFYQTDTWQDWTIVYHLSDPSGAETYDLTIDGNTDFGLPALKDVSGIQRFYTRATNNGAVVYVDAQIPEPASAALLAAGGLLLLKRRRV